MLEWLGIGIEACIGLLVLLVVILIIAFFLKLLIAFLPATFLAILVFLLTENLFWAAIAFLATAFVLGVIDWVR